MHQLPPITGKPSKTCPKCVAIKKSKKLSCCARGGSWYKNCGDEGDSKFDHTWYEGAEACKGKLTECWTDILLRLNTRYYITNPWHV